MRPSKIEVGIVLAILTLAGWLCVSCAPVQPAATSSGVSPTTQPTTQPVAAQQTPAQVVQNIGNAVTTHGPFVQAILAAIPQTASAAAILALVLVFLKFYQKWFTGANAPTTQQQFLANLEGFASDVTGQLTAAFPGKTTQEIQTVVNVVKAAAATQATTPKA